VKTSNLTYFSSPTAENFPAYVFVYEESGLSHPALSNSIPIKNAKRKYYTLLSLKLINSLYNIQQNTFTLIKQQKGTE
jgi:hypothetical protein